MASPTTKLNLHRTPEEREYCVQYRETDFNFVSRLMEEEGIFYFFEHEKTKHTLVLANSQHEFKDCPNQPTARYEMVTHEHWFEDLVTGWSYEQEVTPGAYTIDDFNFESPKVGLVSTVPGKDERQYEIYDYPGEYKKKAAGDSLVGLRMEEEESTRLLAKGTSTCRAFSAGFKFKLKGHYRPDLNREFAIIHVSHLADQGDDYETSSQGSSSQFNYENVVDCIPHPTPYRPRRKTPIPVVHGSQTAIVVGRSGEEIDVDAHGRVKVQFHWDREGKYDEKSSRWIRVSQNWAGARWGAVFLPRIGQEVIVDFLKATPTVRSSQGGCITANQCRLMCCPNTKPKAPSSLTPRKVAAASTRFASRTRRAKSNSFCTARKTWTCASRMIDANGSAATVI
ncbi:MAG: type VI secretion system tip protein TssI/VgrG [Pyrinomonadaceae bacterium]